MIDKFGSIQEMKNLIALFTASVLYLVFLLSIDKKFAAEFRQYLQEN